MMQGRFLSFVPILSSLSLLFASGGDCGGRCGGRCGYGDDAGGLGGSSDQKPQNIYKKSLSMMILIL
jgi:hypothetical protein